jgi:glutathione synthase
MRIGILVNDLLTEKEDYTSVKIAITALKMGHEIFYFDVEDFELMPNEDLSFFAVYFNNVNFKDSKEFVSILYKNKTNKERFNIKDLDVLLLRNNPPEDYKIRPWAQNVGIIFGRIAVSHGVIVLNDPDGLSKAICKTYFQHFPQEIRPKTLITRNKEEIIKFYEENGRKIVIKPYQGFGGKKVFLINPDDLPNINQMINAVGEEGYIIAQEYLPEVKNGDIRLMVVNGLILKYQGKIAAFRRVPKGGDIRANIHAGGSFEKTEITDEIVKIVDIIRPKLVQDGIFITGLDIIGNKLMEVNVFSPGGLVRAEMMEGVNFTEKVIKLLEKKVQYKKLYKTHFSNIELNTM